MNERKELASFLRDARKAAGITQDAAARAAGVSVSYLRAIEGAQRVPTGAVIARIAGALGADPVRALELHKAIKAADIRAKGKRLLALADAGDPEEVNFVWLGLART